MDLAGRVAVVTGASRGVGRAIADALEARGAIVATVARSSARFTADVSDWAACRHPPGFMDCGRLPRILVHVATEIGRCMAFTYIFDGRSRARPQVSNPADVVRLKVPRREWRSGGPALLPLCHSASKLRTTQLFYIDHPYYSK
jgi:NAD(P)-dependent dehydrogenase (short-subunit alcohol dehydrogenase family)